eukprot:Opistho-1_new@75493
MNPPLISPHEAVIRPPVQEGRVQRQTLRVLAQEPKHACVGDLVEVGEHDEVAVREPRDHRHAQLPRRRVPDVVLRKPVALHRCRRGGVDHHVDDAAAKVTDDVRGDLEEAEGLFHARKRNGRFDNDVNVDDIAQLLEANAQEIDLHVEVERVDDAHGARARQSDAAGARTDGRGCVAAVARPALLAHALLPLRLLHAPAKARGAANDHETRARRRLKLVRGAGHGAFRVDDVHGRIPLQSARVFRGTGLGERFIAVPPKRPYALHVRIPIRKAANAPSPRLPATSRRCRRAIPGCCIRAAIAGSFAHAIPATLLSTSVRRRPLVSLGARSVTPIRLCIGRIAGGVVVSYLVRTILRSIVVGVFQNRRHNNVCGIRVAWIGVVVVDCAQRDGGDGRIRHRLAVCACHNAPHARRCDPPQERVKRETEGHQQHEGNGHSDGRASQSNDAHRCAALAAAHAPSRRRRIGEAMSSVPTEEETAQRDSR